MGVWGCKGRKLSKRLRASPVFIWLEPSIALCDGGELSLNTARDQKKSSLQARIKLVKIGQMMPTILQSLFLFFFFKFFLYFVLYFIVLSDLALQISLNLKNTLFALLLLFLFFMHCVLTFVFSHFRSAPSQELMFPIFYLSSKYLPKCEMQDKFVRMFRGKKLLFIKNASK